MDGRSMEIPLGDVSAPFFCQICPYFASDRSSSRHPNSRVFRMFVRLCHPGRGDRGKRDFRPGVRLTPG